MAHPGHIGGDPCIEPKKPIKAQARDPSTKTPRFVSFHVTHRWTPPHVLDQATHAPVPALLRAASASPGVLGCVALVTCHRSELYLETGDPEAATATIQAFFGSARFRAMVGGSPASLRPGSPVKTLEGTETVRHLFRVAAGLDSVLVGEQEILGQVRRARQAAAHERTLTPQLGRLFDAAVRLGRSARTLDAYHSPRRSYAREAVRILEEAAGPVKRRRVGLVGAGDLAFAIARELRARDVGQLVVFNRGAQGARRLARAHAAQHRPLARLAADLPGFDALAIALRAPTPILFLNGHAKAQPPLVDLSTPSVVQGGDRVWRLDQVLERLAKSHRADPDAVRHVESMAREAASRFAREDHDRLGPHEEALRSLNAQAESLAAREVETAISRLRHLSPRDQETVRELARSLRTKLLMPPTRALKDAPPRRRAAIANAAAQLFGLEKAAKGRQGTR